MKPDPHSIFSILEVCARADVNLVKRSILMELARMASLDGQLSSFASQKRIAFFLGMTDRTVRTHLKELEEMGLIRRTRRSNDYGHRKTDVVYLVWDELLKVSKSLPENSSTRQSLPETDDTLPETGRKPTGKLLPVIKNSPDINSPDINYPDNPPTPQGGKRVSVRSILLEVFNEEDSQALIDHRKAVKAPLTVRSAQLLMKKMMRVPDPIEALNLVIEKGWRGFEPEWLEKHRQSKEDDRVKSQFGQFQSPGSHFILKQYLDADKPNSPPPPQMKGLSYEH